MFTEPKFPFLSTEIMMEDRRATVTDTSQRYKLHPPGISTIQKLNPKPPNHLVSCLGTKAVLSVSPKAEYNRNSATEGSPT